MASLSDAQITQANTLESDEFADFKADLAIVDAPWGMNWKSSDRAVRFRQDAGSFTFGLPALSDSVWLFISLALEKLRTPADGGGRVAALVHRAALSASGSQEVRRQILDAGLLESVSRLPEGLAPNTSIPLYLVTFTNSPTEYRQNKTLIFDQRAQFSTSKGRRSILDSALRDVESGLRTWKQGRRNRTVGSLKFTKRTAKLTRSLANGHQLSWPLTTYNDTFIDDEHLTARYGHDSQISIVGDITESVDLDPSYIFGDEAREISDHIRFRGWPARRLSAVLGAPPEAITDKTGPDIPPGILIPTAQSGQVSLGQLQSGSRGRHLLLHVDEDLVDAKFLISWLNSEAGVTSRRRAIAASNSGMHFEALRSDRRSLMRWADELIIPIPEKTTQLSLAAADAQLHSYEATIKDIRENIWVDPENAENSVEEIGHAFDDSIDRWIDQLPFPIASALWTAQTAYSAGEQQLAYIHAWEAIVAFHATALLSASRSDVARSHEIESAIRRTLEGRNLSMRRASFGSWMVIIEKTSSEFRRTLRDDDPDEIARVSRMFGDLSRAAIDRLVSVDVLDKFRDVNSKRNRWQGHPGYTSPDEFSSQVSSLIADLRDLRGLLGNVWLQLPLVRAGSARRSSGGIVQSVEVAMGARSRFKAENFQVGEFMEDGELYLAKDGSQAPVKLGRFVRLLEAPPNAQYTSYFYNRTEGSDVHMVSYQFGTEAGRREDLATYGDDLTDLLG